jgi:hypothetical protein
METLTPSGIECHAVPEVSHLGCRVTRRVRVWYREEASLLNSDGLARYPGHIVGTETTVETVSSWTHDDQVKELELTVDKETSVRIKFGSRRGSGMA